jgi:antitoxin component YwqK of YwqJK toxin-antitoxin module
MKQKKAVMVFLLLVFCGYTAGCGSQHKTKEEYYPDGKLKAVYTYNAEGMLDGVTKKYNEEGKLTTEETYKNNVREGIAKIWSSPEKMDTQLGSFR